MPQTRCGFTTENGILGHQALVTHGPTLYVDIGFDPQYKPGTIPQLPASQLQALVDTGATECCIDRSIVQHLALPIVDRRPVSGIGGKHEVDVCLAQIRIPTLDYTIYGAFACVDLIAGGQRHVALIAVPSCSIS
jgi:hypothetical protein